jgi:hypothetical protein
MTFPTPPPVAFTTGWPGLPSARPRGEGAAPRRPAEFRASLRRRAQLKRAADVVPHLPGPGESLHTLLTGYFDFALVLTVVLKSRPAPCEALRVATLSFSKRNVQELAGWIDAGLVKRLVLLSSDFMKEGNPETYFGAVKELAGQRGQTVAAGRCHAKVACLHFADGLRLVFEGSMNLSTNRNLEQMTVINDPGLHDWHAGWVEQKAAAHESDEGGSPQKG